MPADNSDEFDEADDPGIENGSCECEQAGDWCSGVPGILARVENGQVVNGTAVQRCDGCGRFNSDEAALARLRELGMIPANYVAPDIYERCPDSPDGRHVADPASAKASDGAGRNRGTDWLIDFTCLRCGLSGSVRIDPAEIQWA